MEATEDSYAAYLKVSDQVYSDGGLGSERIDAVAHGSAAHDFKNAAADLAARQLRTVGSTTIDSVRIQNVEKLSDGKISITAYLCSDVSAVDVIDSEGVSRISPDRNARTPYEIVVDLEPPRFFVSSRVVWVGDNFC